MRLSDAIRLGSMLRPQNFYGLLKNGRTCALGAALDAIGVDLDSARWSLDRFDSACLVGRRVTCPVGDRFECGQWAALDAVIVHLNDTHLWPRERIADWVETIERAFGVRADGDVTQIADARAPSLNSPNGGDREKDVSCVSG